MTVCTSALSQNSEAIVCVADRALSYGTSIQWDSDSSKIFELNQHGTLVLFAGSEDVTSRVLGKILGVGDSIGDDVAESRKILEKEYQEAVDELVTARYLTPRLLSKQDYVQATSHHMNAHMRSIAAEIRGYEADCALLVCGFDAQNRPFILYLDSPGTVTDMTRTGFHSIGSGWEKSVSKMLFSEHKKSQELARTLFDTFDAKAFAEMASGVGFDWETWVITKDRKAHHVPDGIDALVEHAWAEHDRSPFDKREKDDADPPPRNWKAQLRKYAKSILPQSSDSTEDRKSTKLSLKKMERARD
jgi:20S proteasome alpha/beta subunit